MAASAQDSCGRILVHAAAVGAAWGGAVAAVKGRFAKQTAPADAATPAGTATPAEAAVPADAATASVGSGAAAKAPGAETEAAKLETSEQEQPAAVAAVDAEWTEVLSSEAGPSESAPAGDLHTAAIEPVHIDAAAEDLEVVSATQQQLHLDEEEASGDACVHFIVMPATPRFDKCSHVLQDVPKAHLRASVCRVPVRGACAGVLQPPSDTVRVRVAGACRSTLRLCISRTWPSW